MNIFIGKGHEATSTKVSRGVKERSNVDRRLEANDEVIHLSNSSRQAVVCAHCGIMWYNDHIPLTEVIYCFYTTVTIMAKRKS